MSRQPLLTRWFTDSAEPRRPRPPPAPRRRPPKLVVCLGGDGLAIKPWLDNGFKLLEVDARYEPEMAVKILKKYAGKVAFAVAFPHCSDLAVAGARWWRRKRLLNPNFQSDAVAELRTTEAMLRLTQAPYAMLTPASATIKKLWKAPSATISPHEYGEYLPENHTHPRLSSIVPARDRYFRRTYIYSGNGFMLPRRKPVKPVWVLKTHRRTGVQRRVSPLLVKRKYTKRVRRLSPLGFAEAVFQIHS